jgi:brefeldin A-inhibited guanine nucleotide-exchange protein
MYCDDSRRQHWSLIETKLIGVCQEALDYFLKLQSEAHREEWTMLLLLVLTRLLKMPDDRVSGETDTIVTSRCFWSLLNCPISKKILDF